jgi:RNA polymerase sigma-70 factor (ECF subfamily)
MSPTNRSSDVNELPEANAIADAPPALERLQRSAGADEMALTAVYEAHRAELLGFLVRMTHDRDAAEDILQEAFIKLITETRAGRPPEQMRAWLYRVAANGAISRGRRGSVWNRLVPRLLDRREPASPEGEALRIERDSELHSALAALPPDARAALLLAAQGFTGQEIAASIGRSEGATRTLLCRSRVQLRLVLEAKEGTA